MKDTPTSHSSSMNIFIIFNSIDNAVVAVFLGVAGHAQGQKSYKLI